MLRLGSRVLCAGIAARAAGWSLCDEQDDDDEELCVSNWSNTHACSPAFVYTPESVAEVERIVAAHHGAREPLRPCGSTLSPNGIGFSRANGGSMLNMALCDEVLEVDRERMLVRVQSGAKVSQVLTALEPHGLTLENLASIAEQQIGGFVGVGAHGTGSSLPPCDEQCVALKIVTPGRGTLELSEDDADGGVLFRLCRVGLGLTGVIVECTLRCVPRHLLREKTEVMTRSEAVKRHPELLRANRHVRFMWIPHVDCVVVVSNNPTHPPPLGDGQGGLPSKFTEEERLAPLRDLLKQCTNADSADNFAGLRDALLKHAPLDLEHVKKVNRAEAEFWRRSQGIDVADSSRKLNFECGGEQWVNECCFPAEQSNDMRFMTSLLDLIEVNGIAAPSPIEQRWSSASSSPMSPAFAKNPQTVHSWVGIIMYLPTEEPSARLAITRAFERYKRMCEEVLWPKFGAVEHWAKIEHPNDEAQKNLARARLARRFDLESLKSVRSELDPRGILGNDLLDAVLPP